MHQGHLFNPDQLDKGLLDLLNNPCYCNIQCWTGPHVLCASNTWAIKVCSNLLNILMVMAMHLSSIYIQIYRAMDDHVWLFKCLLMEFTQGLESKCLDRLVRWQWNIGYKVLQVHRGSTCIQVIE